MNTTAKPTPGPYFLADDKAEDCPDHKDSGLALIDTGRVSDFPIARLMEWNNAKFLHEALTVYHETGLTPRQLADQRAELLAALDAAQEHICNVGMQCRRWNPDACECNEHALMRQIDDARAKAVPK